MANTTLRARLRRLFNEESPRVLALRELKEAAPDLTPAAIQRVLKRLVEDGEIRRVAQGRYTAVDPRIAGPAAHRFSVLTALYSDSAIAGWSALSHWGLTEQVPHIIDLAVRRGTHVRKRPETFRGVRVLYVSPREWFGIARVWVSDGEAVPMFSRERMLYDAFLVPARYGGLGAALDFLQTARDETDFRLGELETVAVEGRSARALSRLARGVEEVFGDRQLSERLQAAATHRAQEAANP